MVQRVLRLSLWNPLLLLLWPLVGAALIHSLGLEENIVPSDSVQARSRLETAVFWLWFPLNVITWGLVLGTIRHAVRMKLGHEDAVRKVFRRSCALLVGTSVTLQLPSLLLSIWILKLVAGDRVISLLWKHRISS